jgi:hypothetical protein
MKLRMSRWRAILLGSLLGGGLLLVLGCGVVGWFAGDVFGKFSAMQERSQRIEREILEKYADPNYEPMTPENSHLVPPPPDMPNLEIRVRDGY